MKDFHPDTWKGADEGEADDHVDAEDFDQNPPNETVGEPKTGGQSEGWIDWGENDEKGDDQW